MPRTTRPDITMAMKIDCLLYRYAVTCAICGKDIKPGQAIEWDHVHALVHGGPHVFSNLRPLHAQCHKPKTAQDVSANAKVKRLAAKPIEKRAPGEPRPPSAWAPRPFNRVKRRKDWPKRPMRRQA